MGTTYEQYEQMEKERYHCANCGYKSERHEFVAIGDGFVPVGSLRCPHCSSEDVHHFNYCCEQEPFEF